MNLQSRLGVGLAGLALVFSVGLVAHQPAPKVIEPDVPQPVSSYVEVMPEGSNENSRIHILDEDGVDKEIRIKYADDSEGLLLLYPSGKVKLERRTFVNGSLRKEANFDEDGVLISGIEKRLDSSILWVAVGQERNRVSTKSYWPSGQLFLERVVDRDSKMTELTFHREDGSVWMNMFRDHDVLVTLKVYDQNARLRVLYGPVTDGSTSAPAQVVYFNEDGTPDFDQRYGYAADTYWDRTSGLPNPNRIVIKSVGVYDSEGRLTTRIYLSIDRRITLIDKFAADASIERLHVQRNGTITQIQTITPGGSSSLYDWEGGFGKAPPLDSRLLVPRPDENEPFKVFQESEVQHADQ